MHKVHLHRVVPIAVALSLLSTPSALQATPSSPDQQGNAGHRYAPPFPWPLLIESRCFPIRNNLLAHVPTTIRLHALPPLLIF